MVTRPHMGFGTLKGFRAASRLARDIVDGTRTRVVVCDHYFSSGARIRFDRDAVRLIAALIRRMSDLRTFYGGIYYCDEEAVLDEFVREVGAALQARCPTRPWCTVSFVASQGPLAHWDWKTESGTLQRAIEYLLARGGLCHGKTAIHLRAVL